MLGERGEMPLGYAFVGRGCHSFRSERGAATTPEGASVSDRPTARKGVLEVRLFYGLIAATRRVAAQGPAPYQKRGPSDRRSVIFSPQASSSLAYARV